MNYSDLVSPCHDILGLAEEILWYRSEAGLEVERLKAFIAIVQQNLTTFCFDEDDWVEPVTNGSEEPVDDTEWIEPVVIKTEPKPKKVDPVIPDPPRVVRLSSSKWRR